MRWNVITRNVLLLILCIPAHAQSSYNARQDSALIHALKYHVSYLADDSLEGRATASEGERKAYRYIIQRYQQMGLTPAGENNTYLQAFEYVEGRVEGKENSLRINDRQFTLGKDYYPLAYSASVSSVKRKCIHAGYGISAPALGHDDYKQKKKWKGKALLINISTPEGTHPHSRFGEHLDLRSRAEKAIEKGAAAVIFYSENDSIENPEKLSDKNIFPLSIPVVFLKNEAWKDVKDEKPRTAELSVELITIEKTGHNVIGKIDNHSSTTVIIGAHYDHLGYGGEGSLHRGEKAIHNGADDNASGVALIIELAKKLKSSVSAASNNYVIAAFSGEELGLYGSKKYAEFLGSEISSINYMLNFDMVGRLNTMERTLQVNGFGTSPAWKVLSAISVDSIRIKTSDSGIGPSDHTSFYLKDIPVLHFFTGAHEDYHKPSDDTEFINYSGIASVLKLTHALIDSLDDDGKIPFTQAGADTTRSTPKFKVTLGVIPDYIYSGEGMRIDGVTEGKPASKAGIQKGDIVIQLGEHKVSDLTGYMKALSHFEKGDTTTVFVKREGITMEFIVTF